MSMSIGIVHIYGTLNNTHVTVTDITRTVLLYKTTGGLHTKAGRQKNSLKIASKIFLDLNAALTQAHIKYLELRTRNRGAGYDKFLTGATRAIQKLLQSHYHVLRVINDTPVVHGQLTRQKEKKR